MGGAGWGGGLFLALEHNGEDRPSKLENTGQQINKNEDH